MKIEYFGHACFVVSLGGYSICIDPFSNVGLKAPNVKTDYYFCSHQHYDHNNYSICGGVELDNEINYEIVDSFHDKNCGALRGKNSILILKGDFTLAHLGDLGEITESIIKKLFNIDVLLCPIGGKYTIDYKEAISLIEKVKPKIVIPMHYKTEGNTVDIDTEENFINNVKASVETHINEIIINKGEFLTETKVVLLKVDR